MHVKRMTATPNQDSVDLAVGDRAADDSVSHRSQSGRCANHSPISEAHVSDLVRKALVDVDLGRRLAEVCPAT